MGKDIFGQAILDFHNNKYPENIIVQSPDFKDDNIPISYLFRNFDNMPKIEQKALELSYGKTLDVGCGAGCHSLYLQNKRNLDVKAIDISQGAINVCKQRGIKNSAVQNVFDLENEKFDSILFLMNGSGIIGKLNYIDRFFMHIKKLLKPNGQVLIDSSDISYLFIDDDGGFWVDAALGYYGEIQYKLKYKDIESDWFDWLYIDYNTLQNAANANGFHCELILEGNDNDFLAKLSIASTSI